MKIRLWAVSFFFWFSAARGHLRVLRVLRVSRVLLDGSRKRETARSLRLLILAIFCIFK